jgi:hypothetical protein
MQPLVLATPRSHDRRMGVALLVFTVLAGALGVAKGATISLQRERVIRRIASVTPTTPVGPHRIQVANGTPQTMR